MKGFEKLLNWLRKKYPGVSTVMFDLRPELACAVDGCGFTRSGAGRGLDRLCHLHRVATPRPKGVAIAARQVTDREQEELSVAALADCVEFAKHAKQN